MQENYQSVVKVSQQRKKVILRILNHTQNIMMSGAGARVGVDTLCY